MKQALKKTIILWYLLGPWVPKDLRSWNIFNLVYFTIYSYASCFIAWVSLCHYFFIYIYYIRAFHAWYAIICQWNKGLYLLLHYMYGIMNLKMYIVPKSWYPRILILQSNKSIFQFIIGKVHCTFRFKILLSQLFQLFFTHWSRTMFFILFYYHLDIFINCWDTFFHQKML